MENSLDWNEIAESLGIRLFAYFKRRGAREQATDLTQEVLVRLFDKACAQAYQAEKGSLAQFAFGIARLVWLEHQKELQNLARLNLALPQLSTLQFESVPTPEDTRRAHEEEHRLRQVMNKLSSIQHEVVTLVADQNLKLREIARILQIPENTVKSHLHRAKEYYVTKFSPRRPCEGRSRTARAYELDEC